MKSRVLFFTLAAFCCFIATAPVIAQEGKPKAQLLSIHQDQVIPSQVEKYEKAAKNLAEAITKSNVSGVAYTVAQMDDFTYIYFTPVENLAAVDKMGESWGELQKKMGKESFDAVMNGFHGTITSHKNFVAHFRPDLSYKPEFGSKIADGLLFRHWDFYFIHPGMEQEAEQIAKEWLALSEKQKSAEGYRLHMGGMGTDGPVIVVSSAAKSAADFYARQEAWMKKAGEAGTNLMMKTWKVVRKFEVKDGMVRPDLSALPKEVATAK